MAYTPLKKPTIQNAVGSLMTMPAAPAAPAPAPMRPGPTIQAAAQLQAVAPKSSPAVSGKPPMSAPAPRPNLPTPSQVVAPGVPGGEDPAMAGSRAMAQQNALKPPTDAPAPAPAAPEAPAPSSNADAQLAALRKSYLGTFDQSPEEKAAQEKLDAITARQEMLRANAQAGEANVAEQAIPFSVIGGQQAAIQRQLAARLGQEAAAAVPLTTQLARLQAAQKARQEKTKAELDFATPKTTDYQTVSEGESIVDPATGKVVFQGTPKTTKAETIGSAETGYYEKQLDGSYKQVVAPKASGDDVTKGVVVGGKLINPVTGAEIYGGDNRSTSPEAVQAIQGKVDLIDSLLTSGGLSGAVGSNIFGRMSIPGFQGDIQTFNAGLDQLVSADTLGALLNLKQQGGTLGALSEGEAAMLRSSSSRLNSWIDRNKEGKIVAVKAPQQEFINELNRIKGLALKAIANAQGTGTQQGPANTPEEAGYEQGADGLYYPKSNGGAGAAQSGNIISANIGGKTVMVNRDIAQKLAYADADFFRATGQHLKINEATRSRERQAELYARYKSGQGGRAAPPGQSFHETGNAVDIANWEAAAPYLRRYGFRNELADDRNHFSIGEFA